MLVYVNGEPFNVCSTTSGCYQWIDTSKYDVVEKKEAKMNRLQDNLSEKLQLVTHFRELVDNYAARVVELNKEIEKIKAEVKELEK
jgi:muramidase (phage lysozyme)